MEGATSTLPRREAGAPVKLRAVPAERWAKFALIVLCAAVAVLFFAWPTYPNFDSYYSLLWGRELLDGTKPSFDGYVTPTEHPLWVVYGALCSLLGDTGDRVMVATALASFVAMVAGLYQLGRVAFGPVVGLIAAVILCSRLDFPFLAVRGYVDVPFLALVLWAAVLEARRPRRGTWPLVLLMFAAMLRPEAWVLSGLYWLYISWKATWAQRAGWAALVAVGPLSWAALDFWATGDPLFSLNHTSDLAGELERDGSILTAPRAVRSFLVALTNLAIFLSGLAGIVLAVWYAPRRATVPLGLFAGGMITFAAVVVAGLSVIPRYMLVSSLMLMVFAAVTLGGWTMLTEHAVARKRWRILASIAAVAGIVYTLARIDLGYYPKDLQFRGDAHDALEQVLRSPEVAAGLKCGPLTVPTHKLQPDVRWILDLSAGEVLARSEWLSPLPKPGGLEGSEVVDPDKDRREANRRAARTGVALVVHQRSALTRQVYVDSEVAPLVNSPPPGFRRVAVSPYYAAYVRCT